MFLFKKVVGSLFSPLPVILSFLISGVIFLCLTKRQRPGKILITIGTIIFILFTYGPIPALLTLPLERKYDAATIVNLNKPDSSRLLGSAKYIVVLGGGISFDPSIPEASQLSGSSLIRLVEGIRLHREFPNTKLVLSGWQGSGPMPEAVVMSQVAQALGVKPESMVIDMDAQDTEAQARIIKAIVKQDRFVLVTSALHLPRALALFRKQGMDPLPGPVGHLVKKSPEPGKSGPAVHLEGFLPSIHALLMSTKAVHEYLGLAWAGLRGLI